MSWSVCNEPTTVAGQPKRQDRTDADGKTMNEKSTYRAIFYGANPIASGTERELAFVDGGYQQTVTLEVDEEGTIVRRVFKLGHMTEEPIAYQYVEDMHDAAAEPDVPN
ncbi:hypothetical protein [Cryobacterium sp. GrIS_2_6]|uniref:hypothetical protein n=1 Tax=Cryobacterium sp. GrIS_2_6 TaxID=3162785 RepID=UPI002E04839F|nr:hypothetical protein [Cryobacterium psychrotolerans]